jgi:hypothetical protein
MPQIEPLKQAAKQDRHKQIRHKAARARKIKLATRDPRRRGG